MPDALVDNELIKAECRWPPGRKDLSGNVSTGCEQRRS